MSYSGRALFPDDEPKAKLLARRLNPPRPVGSYSTEQFLTWAAENNKPSRPIGYFEQNPPAQGPTQPPIAKPSIPTHPIARQMTVDEQQSLDRLLAIKPPEIA
jgi:hypothetical protein